MGFDPELASQPVRLAVCAGPQYHEPERSVLRVAARCAGRQAALSSPDGGIRRELGVRREGTILERYQKFHSRIICRKGAKRRKTKQALLFLLRLPCLSGARSSRE